MLEGLFKRCFVFIAILIFIERFIFGFTIVQGMSMQPTLHNNDKLFINKIIYLFTKPKYGDIIIFHPPIEERKNELFIKRVIAVEGDVFLIKEGRLYINGKEINESYICNEEYKERLYQVTSGKVPKGMVFVMGDNRNDSNDSRCFGFVPTNNIEGKADIRILPIDSIQVFSIQ
ncbi:signal peptidase I [Crassaminicella thermophila]|uniref:Signal peptidase I n=1 Tax=Crassaminicella thermophila TaxID=2599308 RepID=A0A5C0SC94_CRATE|nr:signal peptidase I [Crassaminicella thermophila]QEK11791.1 signal peptidase I [Crassaminicella thermophila]